MRTAPTPASDKHLTLCLTHDCNLRCGYCYAGAKTARHMSAETARAAVELAVAGTGSRLHLVFFGGEPLLRWDRLRSTTVLAEQLTAERNLELLPTVTTNAMLLDEPAARWLAGHQFMVAISCDGTARAHDANRRDGRGASTHRAVMAGIDVALAAGLHLKVVAVVDPTTVDELPTSVAELAARGARALVLSPNWSADWDQADGLVRWERAYRGVAAHYLAAHRAGRPLAISFLDTKIATRVRGGCIAQDRCDLGRQSLVVAPGGNLYPCDRLVGEDRSERFVVGHVLRGLDPARVDAVVHAAGALPSACAGCEIVTRCQNRCACANVAQSDTLGAPSALLCFHERLATELADEVAELLYAERTPSFLRRFYGIRAPTAGCA